MSELIVVFAIVVVVISTRLLLFRQPVKIVQPAQEHTFCDEEFFTSYGEHVIGYDEWMSIINDMVIRGSEYKRLQDEYHAATGMNRMVGSPFYVSPALRVDPEPIQESMRDSFRHGYSSTYIDDGGFSAQIFIRIV